MLHFVKLCSINWAATWQNQQSDCTPTQSDQSLHCALNGQLRTQGFFMQTAKILIRLGGCPGWSESSLGAHLVCWFCHVAAYLLIILIYIIRYTWVQNKPYYREIRAPCEWKDNRGQMSDCRSWTRPSFYSTIKIFCIRIRWEWLVIYCELSSSLGPSDKYCGYWKVRFQIQK